MIEEKNYDPKLTDRSVVTTPDVGERQSPHAHPYILTVAAASQSITPWGTYVRVRDKELRSFWHTEPWLASVVYLVSIRNTSFAWDVVGADASKPSPKNTIRAVKRILNTSNRGKGWKDLITKTCIDLYCLAGTTRVAMGGDRKGSYKTIRDIVRDNDSGPVISIDENGKFVERPITEWHKTPLGGRKWYWLSVKGSLHSKTMRGGLFLTEDHPMLTKRGWVQAKDITLEDKIATYDPTPSEDQSKVLVGGMLGDSNLTKLPKRAILRMGHCIKQLEYLEFKKNLFNGFSWTGQSESKNRIVGVNSRASMGLVAWKQRWYPNGKKIVCREDVEKYFSPEMLAIWFMDDGCRENCTTTAGNICSHGVISTQGFTKEDVEWLIALFNQHGMDCKAQSICGGKYTIIRFSSAGFKVVSDYIGKYVIPSMRYKVREDAPAYDPSVWEIEPAGIYFDDVVVIEPREYHSGAKPCETTYHIGVEDTRNFIAAGMVSHNTADNGAFWELIRTTNNPDAPVINIAHLDSGKCIRTGDPEYPVIYEDYRGKEQVLPYWRVRTLEEFPSPVEEGFGLQVCAVSRCLLAAEIIQSISVYKQEKVGGTFTKAIDAVSGLTQQNIDDAVAMAKEQQLNRNLYRLAMPVIIPGIDPTSSMSHIHIDLASLPDNFDEDTSFKWYVAQLAAAFGVDYQEIAPLMTGNLGSSQQSEIMHLKTRGKGPAVIMGMLEEIINGGLIPSNVEFRFKEQDLRSETEKANARFTRAKDRAMRVKSGELDGEAARRLAIEDGDLPEWLAGEIDQRNPQQDKIDQQGQEFTPNQISSGIDSQMQKTLSMEAVDRIRQHMASDSEHVLQALYGTDEDLEYELMGE